MTKTIDLLENLKKSNCQSRSSIIDKKIQTNSSDAEMIQTPSSTTTNKLLNEINNHMNENETKMNSTKLLIINPSSSSSSNSFSSSSNYYDSNQIDSNNNSTDLSNNNSLYPKLDNIDSSITSTEKENSININLINNTNDNNTKINNNNNKDTSCIKYGELIVLGYNGCINQSSGSNINSRLNSCSGHTSNRRRSKYILKNRDKPNGVKPASQHILQSPQEVDNLMMKNPNHSVTYTLSRNHTVVVQYTSDEKTDMFQIGRSSESAIDFIVLDTLVPSISSNGCKQINQQQQANQQSTISRFSCRIVVDREYPHTARIYAAGFDSSKRIFLGEKATKWTNENGELDGVTTNGVLIMHPTNGFTGQDSKTNEWMEVSVCGAVFSLSESRLSPCLSKSTSNNPNKTNILKDGTLIDLCGATLLWRSIDSLQCTPTKHYLDMNLENLNRLRPQCPVGLKTLLFPSSASSSALKTTQLASALSINNSKTNLVNLNSTNANLNLNDRIPMVYLKCGHVHGQHDWGIKKDNERECPLCRKVGPYVQLLFGLEPSLYCDKEITSDTYNSKINFFKPFAFRPCGHMASESTCKYWSRIMVPQGTTQGLSSICPFCAVTLSKEQPYVKLIFQEGV